MRRTPCGCKFEMVGGGSLKMSYSGPLCDQPSVSNHLFKLAEGFVAFIADQKQARLQLEELKSTLARKPEIKDGHFHAS